MKLAVDQKKLIKNIIKYNTNRKYFGEWTPDALYKCYHTLCTRDDVTSIPLKVGYMSESIICDVLWNEMSYNPARFGSKSPFETNGQNSFLNFSAAQIESKDKDTIILFLKLRSYLSDFIRLAYEYDQNFWTRKKFSDDAITISVQKNIKTGSDSDTKPVPNAGYSMLSVLVRCIHDIAKQNVEDFKYKLYFDSMVKVATSRHPNLLRGTTIQNFAMIQRQANKDLASLEQKPETIHKYLKRKSKLKAEIADTANEISLIESHIDNLKDLEFPGDTRDETDRLKQRKKYLDELEQELESVKQKIKQMSERQI